MATAQTILIRQTKSKTQSNPKQKLTLKSIGLRGVGTSVLRKDTRALRGMLNIVQLWVEADPLDEAQVKKLASKKTTSSKGYVLG